MPTTRSNKLASCHSCLWVGVKIKPPGDRGYSTACPFHRVPFWGYPLDPPYFIPGHPGRGQRLERERPGALQCLAPAPAASLGLRVRLPEKQVRNPKGASPKRGSSKSDGGSGDIINAGEYPFSVSGEKEMESNGHIEQNAATLFPHFFGALQKTKKQQRHMLFPVASGHSGLWGVL